LQPEGGQDGAAEAGARPRDAANDVERAAIIREHAALSSEIAAAHLADQHVAEYQRVIGRTHQAHVPVCDDAARTLKRMQRGEI